MLEEGGALEERWRGCVIVSEVGGEKQDAECVERETDYLWRR